LLLFIHDSENFEIKLYKQFLLTNFEISLLLSALFGIKYSFIAFSIRGSLIRSI
jgi:hypothetical protein